MKDALRRKIFVGCRELGLDADARQAIQLAETGKASMSDMNEADLKLVLNRLEKDGFKPASKGRKFKKSDRKDIRIIHVLWKKIGETGALKDPSRKGLNAFIRSRFSNVWGYEIADVDMLREWKEIDDVIQALKAWAERAEADFHFEDHTR